jgi:WD40 repeat protein
VFSNDKPATPEAAGLPEFVADHRLIRCIGQGAYGTVWLARNEVTQVFRAIKIVLRNAFKDEKPYAREFEAIKRFEPLSRTHPGFIQVLQVGKLEAAFYYIMELADDKTSGSTINPDRYEPHTLERHRLIDPLPVPECAQIGSQLASSLAVLHENKLIHRDIKPSNIIFVNKKPKLADIGLVTQIDEAKSFVGTIGFVAPEGPLKPESDIFSLGIVLYEISTGRDRCEFPLVPQTLSSDNFLALELNQILLKACHPNPQKRYHSASDLQHELDLLQAGKSIKRIRQLEFRERILRRVLIALVVIGLPIFVIVSRYNDLHNREIQAQQRRIGYLLARGADEMRKGDFAASLPFLLDAAAEDKADMRSHRLRVGAALAHASRPIKHWKGSKNAVFSTDGTWLVGQNENAITIYDSQTGAILKNFELNVRPDFVRISDDSTLLAASAKRDVLLLDSATGLQKEKISLDKGEILDVAIHPSNSWVAILSSDGHTLLANLQTGQKARIETREMAAINFDPSGKQILGSSQKENYCRLYDFPSGTPLLSQLPQPLPYRGIFSRGGNILITCGFREANSWDLNATRLQPHRFDADDALVAAAFSPNGHLLATGCYNGAVYLWNGTNYQALSQNHVLYHTGRIEEIAFVDDKTLVVHLNTGQNCVWDLKPRGERIEPVKTIVVPLDKRSLNFDGINLRATTNRVTGTFGDTPIDIEGLGQIEVIAANRAHNVFAVGLADSEIVFHEALLFHPGEQTPFQRLSHRDGILSIQFSADGKQVLTGSEDYRAIVWDVDSGKQISAPMQHDAQVQWASFSKDGKWVATVSQIPFSRIATLVIWEAKTGDPLTPPIRLPDNSAKYVAFEEGDSTVVISNGTTSFRIYLPLVDEPLERYRGVLPSPPAVSRAAPQISLSPSSDRSRPAFFASQSASLF